jgi:hypothetical protein
MAAWPAGVPLHDSAGREPALTSGGSGLFLAACPACNDRTVAPDYADSGTVIDPPSGRRPVPTEWT